MSAALSKMASPSTVHVCIDEKKMHGDYSPLMLLSLSFHATFQYSTQGAFGEK